MLTKHNLFFSPKPSPYLSQHHYSLHTSHFTLLLNSQPMISFLVSPISIIFLPCHHQKLLHQNDPNQKSRSQNLHPRKIFNKFQKTLLKQLLNLNLQKKTKLQLPNTIIHRLTLPAMTPIQPQKKVYLPQIPTHLNKLLRIQSLNMRLFLVSSWPQKQKILVPPLLLSMNLLMIIMMMSKALKQNRFHQFLRFLKNLPNHLLLHGLHLMTSLITNGRLDIKNLLLGLMYK